MSKKYKIAILIDQLVFGGVQKMALENARILNELGHKTELLVLMRKGYRPQYKSFTRGVAIRFLSDSYPWPLKYSIKFPIFSFFSTLHILSPFLSRLAIKEKEFDIIISHGTTTCFTAQGIKRARHVPFLAAIHDPMDYILKKVYSQSPLRYIFPIITPVLSRLEKNIVKDSKQVLLLSNLHQKFISKTYKIKPAILPPATIVPNRITPKEKKYIMASTRWEAGKNPFLLLKVAKAIPQANIAIAGSWTNQTDYQNFKSQIKKNNLESQIHLFPKISEKRLQALYQESRLFIHPIEEAFGMGGLEAAANACPIIIPDGSGITQHFLIWNHTNVLCQFLARLFLVYSYRGNKWPFFPIIYPRQPNMILMRVLFPGQLWWYISLRRTFHQLFSAGFWRDFPMSMTLFCFWLIDPFFLQALVYTKVF